ncbi:DNA-directed RNA polymerase I subunit RPA12 [Dendroctonus ponderosae]
MSTFQKVAGFCSNCGSILPPLGDTGNITCYTCSRVFEPEMLIDEKSTVSYSVHFNSRAAKAHSHSAQGEKEADGPTVERRCPKCGNDTMSYATLQLRSADEGQTVFYTCTKCQYKESENS